MRTTRHFTRRSTADGTVTACTTVPTHRLYEGENQHETETGNGAGRSGCAACGRDAFTRLGCAKTACANWSGNHGLGGHGHSGRDDQAHERADELSRAEHRSQYPFPVVAQSWVGRGRAVYGGEGGRLSYAGSLH